MLRLLLSRPAMLLWGVLLAQWLAEERPRRRPRRRVGGPRRPAPHVRAEDRVDGPPMP